MHVLCPLPSPTLPALAQPSFPQTAWGYVHAPNAPRLQTLFPDSQTFQATEMAPSFPSQLPNFLKEFLTDFTLLTNYLLLSLLELLQLKIIIDLIAKFGILFSAFILYVFSAKFDTAEHTFLLRLMPFWASTLPGLVLPLQLSLVTILFSMPR